MTYSTNRDCGFLRSYEDQVHRLEQDPNATPEYKKGLEREFAAVKAQILGERGAHRGACAGGPTQSGHAHHAHHGGSGTTGSAGSSGGSHGGHGTTGSAGSGGGSHGGHGTAGSAGSGGGSHGGSGNTGSTGSSGGTHGGSGNTGSTGSSGGSHGGSGNTGSTGSSGGSHGDPGTPGGTAADNSTVATSIQSITNSAGPDAANYVQQIIDGLPAIFGGGTVPAPGTQTDKIARFAEKGIADSAARAANAVIRAGGTAEEAAKAAEAIARAAGDAAKAMMDATGDAIEASQTALSIAEAGFNAAFATIDRLAATGLPLGPELGTQVADAAISLVDDAAGTVSFLAGIGATAAEIDSVVKDMARTAEYGGDAGEAVLDAARAAATNDGVQNPGAAAKDAARHAANAAQFIEDDVGSLAESARGAEEVANAVKLGQSVEAGEWVANAAKWAGAEGALDASSAAAAASGEGPDAARSAAQSVSDTAQTIRTQGGDSKDAARATDAAYEATKSVSDAGGKGAAKATRAVAVGALEGGGDGARAVANAAINGGADGAAVAENAADAANAVRHAGGTQEDAASAADAVARAAGAGGPGAAEAAHEAALIGGKDGAGLANETAFTANMVKDAGGTQGEAASAADAFVEAAKSGGKEAFLDTIKEAWREGLDGTEIANVATDIAAAAEIGGVTAARNVSSAFIGGGLRSADNVASVYETLRDLGATNQQIGQASNLIFSNIGRVDGYRAVDTIIAETNTPMNGTTGETAQSYLNSLNALTRTSTLGEGDVSTAAFNIGRAVKNAGGSADDIAYALSQAADKGELILIGSNGNVTTTQNALDATATAIRPGANMRGQINRAFSDAMGPYLYGSSPTNFLARPSTGQILPFFPPASEDLVSAPYDKLWNDLASGADKSTIQKDAQDLAAIAGKVNDSMLQKAALLIGSGFYGNNNAALTVLRNAFPVDSNPSTLDPMSPGDHTPLNDAYLKLEVDISNNADTGTIKADADNVKNLAGSDHPELADAANNIINSSRDGGDGSYEQTASLTALMNNPPNAPAASPPAPPPPPAPEPPPPAPDPRVKIPQPQAVVDELSAYRKLRSDLKSGADSNVIFRDAVALTNAALNNGDLGLAQVAVDIASLHKGFGTKVAQADGINASNELASLTNNAPGTPGAQTPTLPTA